LRRVEGTDPKLDVGPKGSAWFHSNDGETVLDVCPECQWTVYGILVTLDELEKRRKANGFRNADAS
jgi:hypothetical protein